MDEWMFSREELASVPLERASTIPSAWYTQERFHDWEREVVFASSWQWVGHAARIREPGDHLVAEVAGEPVLVVRGADGIARAFFNVCRHRGGPLALEDGSSKTLQCKYHGWTYSLDGRLKQAREMGAVQDFDPCGFALEPLALEEWCGFLFVSLEAPELALTDQMKGIDQRIGKNRFSALHHFKRVVYPMNCNWKAYVDNYLEGYHIPLVHPSLNKILDYKAYRTELAPRYSLQYSPVRSGGAYAEGEVFYYFVYPNLMLNIMPGRCQVNRVLPISASQTEVVFDYFYEEIESDAALAFINEDMAYSDLVQQEDIQICERVQRGLASRSYDQGRFSAVRESGVHHFQNCLKQAYAEAAERKSLFLEGKP